MPCARNTYREHRAALQWHRCSAMLFGESKKQDRLPAFLEHAYRHVLIVHAVIKLIAFANCEVDLNLFQCV
eukprot:scaffold100667_cov18-Tisochrysis_lutea.AAC.2